jgi:phosphoglycolate phosphatase-like HAD superfamily hydrolase
MTQLRSLLLFLVLLVLTSRGLAEIRDIRRLYETLPSIEPGTLLVFDLDNTLIEPVGNFGSDQWYYYLVRKYRRVDGLGEPAAQREATRTWNCVQSSIRIRTVEPGTARFVRQQQARGIRTVGLTAREPSLADTTLTQLRTLDLRLDKRTVFAREFSWWSVEPARFKAGVLFIGEGNDKGSLLIDLLRGLRQRPKRIVFVDDKTNNVKSVDRAARKAGIACIAFRYGATDAKVAEFMRGGARAQLRVEG